MAVLKKIHYQGYVFECAPIPLADGRFSARIAIVSHRGKTVIECQLPALAAFGVEDAAIEYAKRWGKAWVDDNE